MDRCEQCQSLALEYLYDLLEGEELNDFLGHVEGCAACRAALEGARGQQQLLAAAARPAFPAVQFQPPPEELPVSLPLRPARPRRAWRRWAVAAAVLLAAAGLGVPAAHYGYDYAQARAQVAQHQAELAELNRKADKARQELQSLPERRRKAVEEVDQQVRKQQIRLRVEGPASVQAGAHNEYKVFTENLAGQKVATWLDFRVKNQAGEVVYKEEAIPTNEGEHRLVLPPDLPLAPNTRLSLEVVARKGDTDARLTEHLDLVAPLYQTHLATDKPMYRPGEVVRFRSLTLERFSLKPAAEPLRLVYSILKPSGERVVIGYGSAELRRGDAAGKGQSVVLGPDGKPLRGLGAGEWLIEPGSPGGEYTLVVSEQSNRFPEQQRKFLVNNYQPPRLNKELDFSKKTYGPGEEVTAACKAARSGGGARGAALANARVEVTVKVDGQVYGADGKPGQAFALQTDAEGKAAVRFRLPEKIDKGEATVTVAFFDGPSPEPLVRPIPLVLKKL
ncbi:MAG TPA: hypothetical protein VFA26_01035, partial [Gemmataceae bacterium]|nr:hypothetical protein [Gemmataceae bacterium]